MKTRSFLKKTVVALILLAFGVWTVYLWVSLPHDIIRENITIEEAQSLVSFSICLPAYQPTQTNPEPRIIYDADAANVPEETDIRLQYRSASDRKKVLEIYQHYTPAIEMETEYPDKALEEGAEISLLYWISFKKFIALDAAKAHAQIVSSVFQTSGTVWWFYEITEPVKCRSTMTEWIKDHVKYRILSLLPAEEIKKVTLSMLECLSP